MSGRAASGGVAPEASLRYLSGMETIIVLLIVLGAVGLVATPLLRTRKTAVAHAMPVIPLGDDDAIDAAVARYRDAIRAGTLCGRCRFANPEGSRFCADCGAALSEGGVG